MYAKCKITIVSDNICKCTEGERLIFAKNNIKISMNKVVKNLKTEWLTWMNKSYIIVALVGVAQLVGHCLWAEGSQVQSQGGAHTEVADLVPIWGT